MALNFNGESFTSQLLSGLVVLRSLTVAHRLMLNHPMSNIILIISLAAISMAAMPVTGQMHSGGMASQPIPDSCVTKPAQSRCATYKYPNSNAVSDLKMLCAAMPFMGACSVLRACTRAGAGPDHPAGKTSWASHMLHCSSMLNVAVSMLIS